MGKRYREITVHGSSFEMGRQIGEEAREEIRGFASVALERVNKTVNISASRALSVARQSAVMAKKYAPNTMDELRGIEQSSGIDIDELFFLQVRNQLTADSEGGCTSFSSSDTNNAILAQNWDNDPALDPYTIVLTRQPDHGPAFINITQAGIIGYIGFSEAGLGVCLNSLPAPSREIGVPHYFTVRSIFECCSLAEATDAVQCAYRAIPANIMLATPDGPANMEITIDQIHTIRDPQIVTHTNHCLHPNLLPINKDFPELIESSPRLKRVREILGTGFCTIETAKVALRDHSGYPNSICRHTNNDPQTGFWATVFSVVMEISNGKMHISRGNPCENNYESYALV
ncbi:MAG: C45 family peptidase [Candidatus Latescibacterota bacterium]|nr:C45 family peptidase [Candidatus Latescibacterota bacterium]